MPTPPPGAQTFLLWLQLSVPATSFTTLTQAPRRPLKHPTAPPNPKPWLKPLSFPRDAISPPSTLGTLDFEAHLSSDVLHKASPHLQRARLSFPRAQTHLLSSSQPKCVLTPAPLVRLLPDSATPAVLLHSYHLSVEYGSDAKYTLTRVFAE